MAIERVVIAVGLALILHSLSDIIFNPSHYGRGCTIFTIITLIIIMITYEYYTSPNVGDCSNQTFYMTGTANVSEGQQISASQITVKPL